ncbi:MAG TPA: hypothetical protein VF041_17875 [Gemmatimonadaceae bacterium]
MRRKQLIGAGAAAITAGVLLGWLAWTAVMWKRYGRVRRAAGGDPLLDRWLPAYEVSETHETRVAAPAALTYDVASSLRLQQSGVARAVIHAREWIMRARGGGAWPPGGITRQMESWGWSVLAIVPGRAIVLGTATQPWRGDVQFRPLPPDEFLAFDRPGFVRLVTVIAVEPTGRDASLFRVQTRVAATDPEARARFRRYWAVYSPGILLIRRALLRLVRREAERRYREERSRARRAGAAPPAPLPGTGEPAR